MKNDRELILVSLKGTGLFRLDDNDILTATCTNILESNDTIKKIILLSSPDIVHKAYFIADESIYRSIDANFTCEPVNTPAGYQNFTEYRQNNKKADCNHKTSSMNISC